MIQIYGADSIRWFILSDSPPERDVQWSLDGVSAAYKFIQKLWKLNNDILNAKESESNVEDTKLKKSVNKTIYDVTKNLESFQYNVVIANIHEIYNLVNNHLNNNKTSKEVLKSEWEKIIMLLQPMVPHLANECSEKIKKNLYWPKYEAKLLEEKNCTIVVQVDGKKRDILEIEANLDQNEVLKICKNLNNTSKYIKSTTVIKSIYIKNKLVNFITKK